MLSHLIKSLLFMSFSNQHRRHFNNSKFLYYKRDFVPTTCVPPPSPVQIAFNTLKDTGNWPPKSSQNIFQQTFKSSQKLPIHLDSESSAFGYSHSFAQIRNQFVPAATQLLSEYSQKGFSYLVARYKITAFRLLLRAIASNIPQNSLIIPFVNYIEAALPYLRPRNRNRSIDDYEWFRLSSQLQAMPSDTSYTTSQQVTYVLSALDSTTDINAYVEYNGTTPPFDQTQIQVNTSTYPFYSTMNIYEENKGDSFNVPVYDVTNPELFSLTGIGNDAESISSVVQLLTDPQYDPLINDTVLLRQRISSFGPSQYIDRYGLESLDVTFQFEYSLEIFGATQLEFQDPQDPQPWGAS